MMNGVELEDDKAVQSTDGWLATHARGLEARLVGGGPMTFGAYAAVTGILFIVILLTVNAHGNERLGGAELTVRTMSWIENWSNHGFWRYAGLLIYSPDGLSVYKTHTGFHLWALYGVELVTEALTGTFSHRVAGVFNQSIIWAGAALIGWLAMRLARDIPRRHAFLLGLACALVYQTFPMNLMNYWYLNPLSIVIVAMLGFFLAEDYERVLGRDDRRVAAATMVSVGVLALSYSSALTVFFVGAYALAHLLLAGQQCELRGFAIRVVVPAVAVLVFHAAQIAWVERMVPGVSFTGNLNFADFLWRSGLDGSTEFYADHWSLFTRREMSTSYPGVMDPAVLLRWKWLFAGGLVSLAFVVWRHAVAATPQTRAWVVFLTATASAHVLSAFVFSQGIVIHPDVWDVLLAMPLIVALFAFLPAAFEAMTRRTGVVVLLAVVAALCYTMVQLRTYAVVVPVS